MVWSFHKWIYLIIVYNMIVFNEACNWVKEIERSGIKKGGYSNKKAIKVKVLREENRGCGVCCVNCLRNNGSEGSWHLPFPRHLPPYCCCQRTVLKRWTSQDISLCFYTGFYNIKQRWLIVLNISLSYSYFCRWCN